MTLDINKVDWDEVRSDLEGQLSNEECFANGSSGYDAIMHSENINRLEYFIDCIDEENYEALIEYYGEEYFKEYELE
jgi:hypothetical protein